MFVHPGIRRLPQPPITRDRILDTAEALFAERGFAGTAVRDIAAAVGLTAASLYNHFAGKEALYAAVLERGHPAADRRARGPRGATSTSATRSTPRSAARWRTSRAAPTSRA